MSKFPRYLRLLSCFAPLLPLALAAQTVVVTPSNQSIGVSTTLQYSATVTGLASSSVTWLAGGVAGGNASVGTISSTGLYKAPSALPGQNPVTITAKGSDGKTTGSTYILIQPNGPTLTTVSPNPFPIGTFPVTVTGSGFVKGAEIFIAGVQMPTTFVSATTLTCSGATYQGISPALEAVLVRNPGSLPSNTITVPLSANPITISPATASVPLGGTKQFTASGQTNVTWTATAGTISTSGLYTAPTTMPMSSTVTIKATGTGNQSATATVTLTPAASPITISPATASVALGGTQQFTASGQTSVTWSATEGTISTSGLYTAPTTMPMSSTVTIKATGTGNQSATATVTLTNTASPITVSPATASVALGGTQQFTASGQTSVTWTATAGTISTSGLYTAPTTMPMSSTVTIKATGMGNQSGTATVTLTNTASPITISPATASVALGGTQQFTASGQTGVTWSATAGTITTSGLYTAPSTMPSSSTVTIKATGTGNQSATATVTLTTGASPITISPATASVPLGGTQQFTASGQTGVTWTATAGVISTSGLYTAPSTMPSSVTVTIKATGTGNQSATATVTLTSGSSISSAAAHRFLEQAAFGPTPGDVSHLQAIGFQAWINEQFAMPKISTYGGMASSQGGLPNRFLTNAVTNADQLRQRVAFAMSQIFVISITKLIWNDNVAPYEDLLLTDAFANYRQIIQDVTLSPSMGYYLDMANNAAANPAQGTVANENYAREVMQLFSIGTSMLNPDGTRQTDAGGNPIPTYNQTNVTELARVLTGWTFTPQSGPPQWGINVDGNTNMTVPMVAVQAFHDTGSKNLLNGFVSPAGLTAAQDLQGALDNLFNHPNVGPFICKQMIQHLVKSNPTPAYVSRVVAVFNNDGTGVRGNMQAVITAILLDAEARANDSGVAPQPTDGHLQEPALYLPGFVRALNGQMNDQNYFASDLANMYQDIFNPASVFNYYSESYGLPGTTLKGGEFQVFDTFTSIYRANLVSNLFSNYSNPVQTYGPGMTVDLTPYMALVSTPSALVDAFDNALTGGVLPSSFKQIVATAVQNDAGTTTLHQVQTALYLILTSNYYNVWH